MGTEISKETRQVVQTEQHNENEKPSKTFLDLE
jgi:hypothetical protein